MALTLPQLFHIVLINERDNTKEYMTRFAMIRSDCVRVMGKYVPPQREWLRHFIEPLYQFTPHTVGQKVAR